MSDGKEVPEGSKPTRKLVLKVKGINGKGQSEGEQVPPLMNCGEDKNTNNVSDEVQEAAAILCTMKAAVIDKRALDKLWETIERGRKSMRKKDTEYVASAEYARPRNVIIPRNGGILPGVGVEQLMGERSLPFEKVLTNSDVDENQARLNIMKDKAVKHLHPLLRENEVLSKGISVKTYNAAGVEFPMVFKIWCDKAYVLMSGWKQFVLANSLKELQNRMVTIQAFRHATTEELCFLVSPSSSPSIDRSNKSKAIGRSMRL